MHTTMAAPQSRPCNRRWVSCSIDPSPPKGKNCLGLAARDTGQSRLPMPPDSKTGIIIESTMERDGESDATASAVIRHPAGFPCWIVCRPSSTIAPRNSIHRGNARVAHSIPRHPDWNPSRMTEPAPFSPQSQYDKAELVACGLGELFGPGNAQLPVCLLYTSDAADE